MIIYSAGIFFLWVILRRNSGSVVPGDEGRTRSTVAVATPIEEKRVKTLIENRIKVTVVVAVRNEEKNVISLLESLVRQEYPPDLLEIIVVNDNSTDRTPVAISEFMEAHRDSTGISMRLIFNPFHGKKQAVRYGITRSSGEVILTIDGDCTAGPGWVSAHAWWYGGGMDAPVMVLAPVFQRPGRGFWSRFGVWEFSALQAITEATALAGHPVMCNAANMSFAKDEYLRHAGELRDDLPSGDDIFLLHAVMRDGGRIHFTGSRAAAVETAAAVTAAALLRQRSRWASKAWYYRDPATLTLAAATAACNAAVTAAAVAALLSVSYLPLLGALYAIRTAPDYLIITRNIRKRGEKNPLVPFVLSELIYPFYFMTVAVISLFPPARRFRER